MRKDGEEMSSLHLKKESISNYGHLLQTEDPCFKNSCTQKDHLLMHVQCHYLCILNQRKNNILYCSIQHLKTNFGLNIKVQAFKIILIVTNRCKQSLNLHQCCRRLLSTGSHPNNQLTKMQPGPCTMCISPGASDG